MAIGNALNLTTSGMVAADGAGTYTGRTLTAGTGISISNGNGTGGNPTISATGGGLTWTTVSGTSQSAAVNNGYITNNAGAVTVTLPATAAIGETVEIAGLGAGGWIVAVATGQSIHIGSSTTTVTTGTLASTNRYDNLIIKCVVANTEWQAKPVGNITVT